MVILGPGTDLGCCVPGAGLPPLLVAGGACALLLDWGGTFKSARAIVWLGCDNRSNADFRGCDCPVECAGRAVGEPWPL